MNLNEILDSLGIRNKLSNETLAEYIIDDMTNRVVQCVNEVKQTMRLLTGQSSMELFEMPAEPYSFLIGINDGSAIKVSLSALSVAEMDEIVKEGMK